MPLPRAFPITGAHTSHPPTLLFSWQRLWRAAPPILPHMTGLPVFSSFGLVSIFYCTATNQRLESIISSKPLFSLKSILTRSMTSRSFVICPCPYFQPCLLAWLYVTFSFSFSSNGFSPWPAALSFPPARKWPLTSPVQLPNVGAHHPLGQGAHHPPGQGAHPTTVPLGLSLPSVTAPAPLFPAPATSLKSFLCISLSH